MRDKARAWFRQPWAFNRCLLVLKKYETYSDLGELTFDVCSFWVQSHKVLVGFQIQRLATACTEKICIVEEIDDGGKKLWGKRIRVRVSVNVHRPLKDGCWLNLPNGACAMGEILFRKAAKLFFLFMVILTMRKWIAIWSFTFGLLISQLRKGLDLF